MNSIDSVSSDDDCCRPVDKTVDHCQEGSFFVVVSLPGNQGFEASEGKREVLLSVIPLAIFS